MSIHKNRKDEHVALAEQFYQTAVASDFDSIRFIHQSFPGIDWENVKINTSFAGIDFSFPFFINGMTGGSKKTQQINHDLATVARETGLAMASGSVSAGIKHPETKESYAIIRKTNPQGKIFANMGPEHPLENYFQAVELLQADALQIHVNAPQELVMPEGERKFSHWLTNIQQVVEKVGVPVIVKEVGFGMSRETIRQLVETGVKTIDVSGRGGTNFIQIENSRRENKEFSFAEHWGQSTPIALLEANSQPEPLEILASGGIRTPFEIVKSLALGARAVGISGQFLHLVVNEGIEKTIEEVTRWKESIRTMMTLLGAEEIADLQQTDIILYEPLKTWCEARHIDWRTYANRSSL